MILFDGLSPALLWVDSASTLPVGSPDLPVAYA